VIGAVGLCRCGVASGKCLGGSIRVEWDLPKVGAGVTEAVEDNDVVVHYFDVVVVEYRGASVITQLSDGEECMCKLRKDVCFSGLWWQEGDVDVACVCGLYFGFVR